MNAEWQGILVVLVTFLGMLVLLDVGRRLGQRRRAMDPEGAEAGLGSVDGAIFGLMGLLIAFTFSGAASRYDARRSMAIEEVNSIGTAWLRLDLVTGSAQIPLREKLRAYTEARLAVFSKLPDLEASKIELARAAALQIELWNLAVAACRDSNSLSAGILLLPALNQMFDMATSRNVQAQMHPPLIIYQLLVVLVLASSLLAGYALGVGKVRHWLHAISFALVILLALYVILDFEFPRLGLIRIQTNDPLFVDLLKSMKP